MKPDTTFARLARSASGKAGTQSQLRRRLNATEIQKHLSRLLTLPWALGIGALAIGLGAGPTSAVAAVITVTTTADSGPGSLRQALANANNGDTIDATGAAGTITPTNGTFYVTNSVTILGSGANVLAVTGYGGNRAFVITAPSTSNIPDITIAGIAITGLFIEDGFNGEAGIYNNGATVTISNCTVAGCWVSLGGIGGAINNVGNGTMRIVNSTIAGNRVAGRIDLPAPTPPDMRVRVRRFLAGPKD